MEPIIAETAAPKPVTAPRPATALAEVEAFPGMEVDGVVLRGRDLEQWLVRKGELGGARFGRTANELMEEFGLYEQQFMAANRNMPVAARLQAAMEYATEKMGINVYFWLK